MARILFIDSSPRNRKQVEGIIRLRTDHQLILAEDGLQAFERLQEAVPDLILMELFLPRVDGFHIYKILKGQEATARIPIVLSTCVELDVITRARVNQLQLEGRIEMPVSASELVEVVSLALIRRKEVRPLKGEQIDGAPAGVSRVIWPRIERPPEPPNPEGPPRVEGDPQKEVKPVVWPRAGSREDKGSQTGQVADEQAIPEPLRPPLKKPSGRELRARLAMQASQGPELPPDTRSPGVSRGRTTGRGEAGNKHPDIVSEEAGAEKEEARRAQALLKRFGRSATPPQQDSTGFRPFPLEEADPARVIDSTRRGKEKDGAQNTADQGEKGQEEQTIRSVKWSLIKKKESE